MIVYKYLHPERIDVLRDSRIRFTQPAALNDPFEVRPNLRELYRSSPQEFHQAIRDTFGRANEDNASELAFLSLSKNRNNLLMWSHYCDSHRGFVVGFDSTHPFFVLPTRGKGVLKKVTYSSNRPVLPAPDDPYLDEFQQKGVNVFTKSKHWRYEKELRMCASPMAADEPPKPGPNGHQLYLFRFPRESVREVIMGNRMLAKAEETIVEIVCDTYHKTKLYKAALNESEYDLDIVPYSG